MEQTVLRPKPMPGQSPQEAGGQGPVRRPHAAPRRARRSRTLLLGLGAGAALLLCGIAIGFAVAAVTGVGGPAGPSRQAPPPAPGAHATPTAAPAPPAATLGVEVADGEKAGALVVAVHVPGPGYTAGLVRGDIVLQLGADRVDTAADLARAVSRSRPGRAVLLTVRHGSGAYQQLTVTPGLVT
ncbi:PDZ domain-containing protein [Streptomyces sp. SudanB182_2057]|uniref:PDZ domain-containing protein n=1 Tax=Streptomyces sp. SudanB182_2057 TaxID=3035281 RepID=UPI003F5525EC